MSMLRTVRRQARLTRHLVATAGPRWLLFRASYAAQLRSGLMERRLRLSAWSEVPLSAALTDSSLAEPATYDAYRKSGAPAFFFSAVDREPAAALLRGWDTADADPVQEAEELRLGRLRYFSQAPVHVGSPPDWHANPFSGERVPAVRHWSRISDFGHGDIKVIWEPSRFGFAYTLVRAYWRTGNEAYPDLFWQWLESWRAGNPPYRGPNWKCGQETSLRVMAWCFALYGFIGARATTADRVAALAQMIDLSGHRVEATLGYALSQRNNHGISEGMGLWTIGLLFPELRAAGRWRERGRHTLEAQARELIYEDGAFSQHSLNYHRLMLHDLLWSLRLGDLNGQPLTDQLRERVYRAGVFLRELQDETSGSVPHYGHDDGALILPLSNCTYRDFRPVVQAVHFFRTGSRHFPAGPWDEELFWLFGSAAPAPSAQPVERTNWNAPVGGYYALRSPSGFAFTRCAAFRDRPGQADLLHVDVWWRGQNIALDAGTFSYNAAPPWDNALAVTAVHNTVTVDDAGQMDAVGRFLWLPWARGTVRRQAASGGGQLSYWEGQHDGFRRLPAAVLHRRALLGLPDDHWLVLDDLAGSAAATFRLHWLLTDVPAELRLTEAGHQDRQARLTLRTIQGPYTIVVGPVLADGDVDLARADPASVRGWQSPHYLQKAPARSLALSRRSAATRFWTLLGPADAVVAGSRTGYTITTERWQAEVSMEELGAPTLVRHIVLSGAVADTLALFA